MTDKKLITISLWVAKILLASSFAWAGFMKLFTSPDTLAQMWPWTAQHPDLTMATGIFDLLAATGFALSSLLRKPSALSRYTAAGMSLLMIAAIVFHLSRGEASQTGINFAFLLLSVFIALKDK